MLPALTAVLTVGLLQDGPPDPAMDTGGWVFMGLAWVTVGSLLVWSFVRVITGGKSPDGEAG